MPKLLHAGPRRHIPVPATGVVRSNSMLVIVLDVPRPTLACDVGSVASKGSAAAPARGRQRRLVLLVEVPALGLL